MELKYKSSQSTTDLFRAVRSRIPKEQVQESTSVLLDYLEKIDLTEQGVVENIREYLLNITELLKGGAKITVLTHNKVLFYFTNYYKQLIDDSLQRIHGTLRKFDDDIDVFNNFNPFLEMLLAMSSANDNDSLICAQSSGFHEFLTNLLMNTKDSHTLAKTIKIIYNFVYEKPQTADMFDCNSLIEKLYNNYNEYFFMNHVKEFRGEENQNIVIQQVIIPSFELVLVFLVYSSLKSKLFLDSVFRIVVTFENILEKRRSNEDQEIYLLQTKMVLFQLNYILTHSNKYIIDRFSTFNIIQLLINRISYGDEIAIYALECLREYAKYFSAAFLIIRTSKIEDTYNFNTYRPSVSDFSSQEKYIKAVKTFCQVWTNTIISILKEKDSTKSRIQVAKINIQNNAQSLLEYFQSVSEIKDESFEYQQIISRAFISFTNINDDNTLNCLIARAPDIIEKLDRVLEERNPDDIFIITTGLINVIEFYHKNGSRIEQIRSDLNTYRDDILIGLNEMRESFENPSQEQIMQLDEDVNRINEIYPSEE